MPMYNNSLHQRISCTIKLPKGSHQSMIDEPIDLQGGAELSTPVCLPPNHSRRFTYWARFGRPARFNSELHEFPGETRISITLLDERDGNLITSSFLARDSDIGFVDEVEQLH